MPRKVEVDNALSFDLHCRRLFTHHATQCMLGEEKISFREGIASILAYIFIRQRWRALSPGLSRCAIYGGVSVQFGISSSKHLL